MSGPKRRTGQRAAADLEALGWRVVKGRAGHYKAYCPCGEHMLVFPSSGGAGRGEANLRALMRRMQGECAQS